MKNKVNIDLSVIVPIYNTEAYLPVCLDSLLGIDGPCVEIVLVDDGSTDGSGMIADTYAQKDSRIRVIHQANGGASVARNTGLEVTQGEYITFVDSDDWVDASALSALCQKAIRYGADMMTGNIRFCDQHGEMGDLFNPIQVFSPQILSGKEGFIYLVQRRTYLPMPFKYLYRRAFLSDTQIRFEEG